ncbi:MAG: fibronectin type III domain-containing protein, partial [Spirochaetota bacterium]
MKQTEMNKRMNRTTLLGLCIILATINLTGACKNGFFMPDQEKDNALVATGTGSIMISTGEPSARTILPELPAIEKYDIRLTRSGYTTVVIPDHLEASKTVTDLPIGTWIVTVDAKAGGLVIASGSSPVPVVINEVTPVTVTLEYYKFSGQGDLVVDIAFPDAIGVDAVEYLKMPMGAVTVGPFVLGISDDAGDTSSVTVSEPGVDAGSYVLTIRFNRAGVLLATVVEAVHVYGNLTTSPDASPEIILLPEDFNAPPPAPDADSVVVTDNTANAAVVSWTALTSYTETGFVVERHETADFTDVVPVQFNVAANATSYTDTSVVPGTISYHYRVKALNTFGESGWTEAASGIVVTYVQTFSYTINSDSVLLGYPGYTVIHGDLTITGITTLTDLSPLANLQRIEGTLSIQSNSGLSSLAGLENLAEVTGQIYLTGNPNLTSLAGLGVQGEVGSINLTNTSLSSLAGLEGITSTGGIYLQGNTALINLAGLAGITSISDGLAVYSHANLTDSTFPDLGSVTTYISISENHKLANTSFPSLTTVGSSFVYDANGRDVTGESNLSAPALATVGNRIELDGYNNYSPYTQGRLVSVNLGSFGSPLPVGETGSEKFIKIMEWPNLQSISMNGLSVVHGNLDMYTLSACNAVSFESLVTIGGYLNLNNVDQLTVVGFPMLSQIGQYLAIQYNNALASIQSFGPGLTIGQGVRIYQNPVLAITTGLAAITSVGAELDITYNGPASGTSTLSMTNLETVGTYVSIWANGFQTIDIGVQSIGTYLNVNLNDRVETAAFERLQTVGTSMWFSGNGKDGPGYAAAFPALSSVGSQVEFDGYYDYSPYSQGKLASLVLGSPGLPLTIGATGSAGSQYLKKYTNPSLASIQADGLTRVYGELYLGSNAACASIALSALESVGGRLEVFDQDQITTLALPALTSVPSHLRITGNNLLAAITSLGTGLAVGGELDISSNPALIDTSGLDAITSVDSFLKISSNGPAEGGAPSLNMSNLGSVGDYLSIDYNNFTTIALSVTDVAGHVSVHENSRLQTLTLDQLSTVGTYFNLLYNGRYGTGLDASFAGLT